MASRKKKIEVEAPEVEPEGPIGAEATIARMQDEVSDGTWAMDRSIREHAAREKVPMDVARRWSKTALAEVIKNAGTRAEVKAIASAAAYRAMRDATANGNVSSAVKALELYVKINGVGEGTVITEDPAWGKLRLVLGEIFRGHPDLAARFEQEASQVIGDVPALPEKAEERRCADS